MNQIFIFYSCPSGFSTEPRSSRLHLTLIKLTNLHRRTPIASKSSALLCSCGPSAQNRTQTVSDARPSLFRYSNEGLSEVSDSNHRLPVGLRSACQELDNICVCWWKRLLCCVGCAAWSSCGFSHSQKLKFEPWRGVYFHKTHNPDSKRELEHTIKCRLNRMSSFANNFFFNVNPNTRINVGSVCLFKTTGKLKLNISLICWAWIFFLSTLCLCSC